MQNKNRKIKPGTVGNFNVDGKAGAQDAYCEINGGIPDCRTISHSGKRFGLLKVISYAGKLGTKSVWWNCVCRCGRIVQKPAGSLTAGKVKSCGKPGCKKGTSHGLSKKSKAYHRWRCMIERCYKETNDNYSHYGGNGIRVCNRWKRFENFLSDMGEPPVGTVLDRIDSKKGYSKSNCRWATFKKSTENRSNTVWIECEGEKMRVNDLAEKYNLTPGLIYNRLRMRWPVSKIIRYQALKNWPRHLASPKSRFMEK